jgi:hypothetical protein
MFRQRPGNSPRAGSQIQYEIVALERQHLDQLVRQRRADTRQAALVELGGMRWIVKAGFVLVAVIVGMGVFVILGMIVIVTVLVFVASVIGGVRALVLMPVNMSMLVRMAVLMILMIVVLPV